MPDCTAKTPIRNEIVTRRNEAYHIRKYLVLDIIPGRTQIRHVARNSKLDALGAFGQRLTEARGLQPALRIGIDQ
jgi:hypothetical protein